MKLNGKFAEATGKLVNKLPSPAVKFIQKLGSQKVNSFLTYGLIALDTGVSVLDSVSIYGGLDAGFMQCAELDEFLESIIENSDIKEMREAASDVKKMLEDDSEKMYYGALSVVQDVIKGVGTTGVTWTLTHLGPIGWAAYLGWGLGNLASGTGKIDEKALRKERFTINELEERLRGNNVVNLGDVEYAILETSGQVTVIQKPEKRTTIPEDFQIQPEYEGIPYDLVIDGKIMGKNLQALGKNYAWLKKQVEKFKMQPEEALVVTIDGKGQIFCQKKERE